MAYLSDGYYRSSIRNETSSDWKMLELEGRIRRAQELINNMSVNEARLKEEMKKIMQENKKLKAEVEKIHSRFNILDL